MDDNWKFLGQSVKPGAQGPSSSSSLNNVLDDY
jgi:hypothetical protein